MHAHESGKSCFYNSPAVLKEWVVKIRRAAAFVRHKTLWLAAVTQKKFAWCNKY
jgi:hypothetical protein